MTKPTRDIPPEPKKLFAETPSQPAQPQQEPVAWMRRWAFDGEVPAKSKNDTGRWHWPIKFKLLPVTQHQCLNDDLPLYTSSPVQQEPAGYADKIAFESAMKVGKGCDVWPVKGDYEARTGRALIALYTSPPTLSLAQRKPWVGLTDEDFNSDMFSITSLGVCDIATIKSIAKDVEAKLREKNT